MACFSLKGKQHDLLASVVKPAIPSFRNSRGSPAAVPAAPYRTLSAGGSASRARKRRLSMGACNAAREGWSSLVAVEARLPDRNAAAGLLPEFSPESHSIRQFKHLIDLLTKINTAMPTKTTVRRSIEAVAEKVAECGVRSGAENEQGSFWIFNLMEYRYRRQS